MNALKESKKNDFIQTVPPTLNENVMDKILAKLEDIATRLDAIEERLDTIDVRLSDLDLDTGDGFERDSY